MVVVVGAVLVVGMVVDSVTGVVDVVVCLEIRIFCNRASTFALSVVDLIVEKAEPVLGVVAMFLCPKLLFSTA